MKRLFSALTVLALLFNACGSGKSNKTQTLGETNSSYTYILFDLLHVSTVLGNSCVCNGCTDCDTVPFKDLLESFPD